MIRITTPMALQRRLGEAACVAGGYIALAKRLAEQQKKKEKK